MVKSPPGAVGAGLAWRCGCRFESPDESLVFRARRVMEAVQAAFFKGSVSRIAMKAACDGSGDSVGASRREPEQIVHCCEEMPRPCHSVERAR